MLLDVIDINIRYFLAAVDATHILSTPRSDIWWHFDNLIVAWFFLKRNVMNALS